MNLKLFFNFFFIIGFSINQNLYSQNSINVSYLKKADMLIDTMGTNEAKNTIAKINKMVAKDVENLVYELEIQQFCSVFQEKKSLTVETNSNPIRNMASSFGGTNGFFYLNKKDSTYLNFREFSGNNFRIKMGAKKWQIHSSDYKYIDKYKCIKATTVDTVINPKGIFKFDVVAWFSPELPSFFGPAGYFGLPGLILELHNGKISLMAKEISFVKKKNTFFDAKKKKAKLVTQKQFDSIVEQTAKNFFKVSKF